MILILIPTVGFSQERFNQFYDYPGYDYARDVTQTTDKGYVTTGFTNSFDQAPNSDAFLFKVDSSGNWLWYKAYGDSQSDNAYKVVEDANGNLIICGSATTPGVTDYDVLLVKTDADGNQLWRKTFGTTEWDIAYSIDIATDGGFILTGLTYGGTQGEADVLLIKTDADGNVEWTKFHGGPLDDSGSDIKVNPNGGYTIIGKTESFGQGDSDGYLINTDINGDLVWQKTIGASGFEEGTACVWKSNSVLGVCGNSNSYSGDGNSDLFVYTYNANGDSLNGKTYTNFGGNPVSDEFARDMDVSSDNGFIITGFTGGLSDAGDMLILRTNDAGFYSWAKSYSAEYDDGYSIETAHDGGYIMCGQTDAGADIANIFLVKVDANGDTSVVAISDIDDPFIEISRSTLVYPNPNSGVFQISLPDGVGRNIDVQVVDVQGRVLKQIGTMNELEMMPADMSEMTAGVYLLQFKSSLGTFYKRLIIR